jgi:hypothetical protein
MGFSDVLERRVLKKNKRRWVSFSQGVVYASAGSAEEVEGFMRENHPGVDYSLRYVSSSLNVRRRKPSGWYIPS